MQKFEEESHAIDSICLAYLPYAWQPVINPIQSDFNMNALAHELTGGDRRSIGKSNRVVHKVLREPARFAEIIAGLGDSNPLVRMRCADVGH
jgi:hypothetical protein